MEAKLDGRTGLLYYSDNTTELRVAFIHKHITSRPGVTNELREQGELLLGN
jgi:hypothetical protein